MRERERERGGGVLPKNGFFSRGILWEHLHDCDLHYVPDDYTA